MLEPLYPPELKNPCIRNILDQFKAGSLEISVAVDVFEVELRIVA